MRRKQDNDCQEPEGFWARMKQATADILNNVAVRVTTLIITGVMVAMGWINTAISYIVQFLTQLLTSMPPVPVVY